jgi:hypothetical protein
MPVLLQEAGRWHQSSALLRAHLCSGWVAAGVVFRCLAVRGVCCGGGEASYGQVPGNQMPASTQLTILLDGANQLCWRSRFCPQVWPDDASNHSHLVRPPACSLLYRVLLGRAVHRAVGISCCSVFGLCGSAKYAGSKVQFWGTQAALVCSMCLVPSEWRQCLGRPLWLRGSGVWPNYVRQLSMTRWQLPVVLASVPIRSRDIICCGAALCPGRPVSTQNAQPIRCRFWNFVPVGESPSQFSG